MWKTLSEPDQRPNRLLREESAPWRDMQAILVWYVSVTRLHCICLGSTSRLAPSTRTPPQLPSYSQQWKTVSGGVVDDLITERVNIRGWRCVILSQPP